MFRKSYLPFMITSSSEKERKGDEKEGRKKRRKKKGRKKEKKDKEDGEGCRSGVSKVDTATLWFVVMGLKSKRCT